MKETASLQALHYLQLLKLPDIGPVKVKNLLNQFGSVEKIRQANFKEIIQINAISEKNAKTILSEWPVDFAESEIELAEKHKVRIICQEDSDYPVMLTHTPDPPVCIYVKGNLKETDALSIGTVGTRRCSTYALEQAEKFSYELATLGFTIVSGLALGVDGAAHRGALKGLGRTIAVLGNGFPAIFPPDHIKLADKIINEEAGAVITESPMNTNPSKETFPRRNRIIAGLSLGIIIVEAGKRSGALITGRLASEYNREVFCIPGRIDQPNKTLGSNSLIRDGAAKLIINTTDILHELGEIGKLMNEPDESDVIKEKIQASISNVKGKSGKKNIVASKNHNIVDNNSESTKISPEKSINVASILPSLSELESKLYSSFSDEVMSIDSLQEVSEMPVHVITSTLTSLQLKGLVQQLAGSQFQKVS